MDFYSMVVGGLFWLRTGIIALEYCSTALGGVKGQIAHNMASTGWPLQHCQSHCTRPLAPSYLGGVGKPRGHLITVLRQTHHTQSSALFKAKGSICIVFTQMQRKDMFCIVTIKGRIKYII
jgi:hypothetical protein